MSHQEAHAVMQLAMGRIFRLGARATQPGDIEQYEVARRAMLDAADVLGISTFVYRPNVARDR